LVAFGLVSPEAFEGVTAGDLVGLGFEQETANTILDKVSSEEEVDSSSPEANSEEQES
jgi:hypothetical protein